MSSLKEHNYAKKKEVPNLSLGKEKISITLIIWKQSPETSKHRQVEMGLKQTLPETSKQRRAKSTSNLKGSL